MKQETIDRILKLAEEKKKLLERFKNCLRITDPNFYPDSVSIDGVNTFKITSGSRVYRFKSHYDFTIDDIDGKYCTDVTVEDPSPAVEWIEEMIERLNKINKELDDI